MKILSQSQVPVAYTNDSTFNSCEHLFVEIEAGKGQTVSCKLPNGKFVTFAFVAGRGDEIECVDIHTNAGNEIKQAEVGIKKPVKTIGHQHHVIGFTKGNSAFDTRKIESPVSLITLLLGKNHYQA